MAPDGHRTLRILRRGVPNDTRRCPLTSLSHVHTEEVTGSIPVFPTIDKAKPTVRSVEGLGSSPVSTVGPKAARKPARGGKLAPWEPRATAALPPERRTGIVRRVPAGHVVSRAIPAGRQSLKRSPVQVRAIACKVAATILLVAKPPVEIAAARGQLAAHSAAGLLNRVSRPANPSGAAKPADHGRSQQFDRDQDHAD
jgi:hypothetical protein